MNEASPSGAAGGGLFRAKALERMASPDRLDLAANVVRPAAWLLLVTAAIVVMVAIAASVLIFIPVKVSADGILLPPAGVNEVVADTSGQLVEMKVHLGDVVHEGQVVATLRQADLKQEIEAAKAELGDAQEQLRQVIDFQKRAQASQQTYRAQLRQTLQASIAFAQQRVDWSTDRVKGQEELVQEGYSPKQKLVEARVELGQAREDLARNQNSLKQLDVEEAREAADNERERLNMELHVSNAKRKVAMLMERLGRMDVVTSPYSGVVAEVKLNAGEVVQRATPILTLVPEPPSTDHATRRGPPVPLVATLYVAAADGKRVRPGMDAEIIPSTAKREEHGFIRGRILSVAEVPATQEGMQRVLKNRQLVQSLSAAGAVFEVRAELDTDPRTPTGFRWSSSMGPEQPLSGGSPCRAEIVIRSQPMLQLILPVLRRLVPGAA